MCITGPSNFLRVYCLEYLIFYSQTALEYHIQNATLLWDVLFGKMEEVKVKYEKLIAEYSITETTLEQVFITLARMQRPGRDVAPSV